MGFGDDIMASGVAREIHERAGENVVIGKAPKRPFPSSMFNNISWINNGDGVLVKSFPGYRDYLNLKKSTGARQVLDPKHRPKRGVLKFSAEELHLGDALMDCKPAVVLEPHVKGEFSGQNKAWPWARWVNLLRMLQSVNYRVVQISKPGTTTLPDVDFRIAESDVRVALSCLRWADPLITTDGLLHHAAAALKVPAIVLWGSRTDPKVLGYREHKNISTGPPYCGMRVRCEHCEKAMRKISVRAVFEAMMLEKVKR